MHNTQSQPRSSEIINPACTTIANCDQSRHPGILWPGPESPRVNDTQTETRRRSVLHADCAPVCWWWAPNHRELTRALGWFAGAYRDVEMTTLLRIHDGLSRSGDRATRELGEPVRNVRSARLYVPRKSYATTAPCSCDYTRETVSQLGTRERSQRLHELAHFVSPLFGAAQAERRRASPPSAYNRPVYTYHTTTHSHG